MRTDSEGQYYATFNAHFLNLVEPEPDIAALLAIVESFDDSLRAVWSGCTLREFNIGYDCGNRPWAFNQGLSGHLLSRMAAAGASLRITLYPPARKFCPQRPLHFFVK